MSTRFVTFLGMEGLVVTAKVPPAFDNSGSNDGVTAASTISWTHNVISNTNGILFVAIDGYSDNATNVTAITYSGSAMTHLGGQGMNTQWSDFNDVWILKNPPTGNNAVSISLDSTANGIAGGSTSWTGVNQTTPTSGFVTSSGADASPTITITSAAGEIAHDSVHFTSAAETISCNQTQRWIHNTNENSKGGGSSKTGAGSTTLTWTITNNRNWYSNGWSIKPV